MRLEMEYEFSIFNYIFAVVENSFSGFTVLIPDYYRGEPAKREWFFNGQIRSWMQKQTKWENLGQINLSQNTVPVLSEPPSCGNIK